MLTLRRGRSAVAMLLAFVAVAGAQEPRQATLRILQLDVAQGDATLITTEDGRHVLIDAGPRNARVADWLSEAGIDTLHLVIASHAHADHIGGMAEVLARVVVRAYM